MLSNRWAMGRGKELLEAAREGRVEKVETLLGQLTKRSGPFPSLRRGGNTINVQDEHGQTALHHACLSQNKEIVKLLLSVDASPCIVDNSGTAPLHYAAFNGNTEIVDMLLAHNNPPDIDQQTKIKKESALMMAARVGHMGVVLLLTSKGANVALTDADGASALDLASQFGKTDVVTHLLRTFPELVEQYKLPASKTKSFVTTPLHIACRHGQKEIVLELLAAGVDPNVFATGPSRDDNTKLDLKDDGTPLHVAVFYARASIVRILVTKGADLYIKNRDGLTIKDILAEQKHEASRKILRVINEFEKMAKLAEQQNTLIDSEDERPPVSPSPNSRTPGFFNPTGISNGVMVLPPDIISEASMFNTIPRKHKKNVVTNNNQLGLESKKRTYTVSHTSNVIKPVRPISFHEKSELKNSKLDLETKDHLYANNSELEIDTLADKINSSAKVNDVEYGNIMDSNNFKELQKKFSARAKGFNYLTPLPPPKPFPCIRKFVEDASKQSESNQILVCDSATHCCRDSEIDSNHSLDYDETDTQAFSERDIYQNVDPVPCDLYEIMDGNSKIHSDIPLADNDYLIMKTNKASTTKRSSSNKIYSVHCRGDHCCIYAPNEDQYKYIYIINKEVTHPQNGDIFKRVKEKAEPMPCFCDRKNERLKKSSSDVFKSCESVYVDVANNRESTSSKPDYDAIDRIDTQNVKVKADSEEEPLAGNLSFHPFKPQSQISQPEQPTVVTAEKSVCRNTRNIKVKADSEEEPLAGNLSFYPFKPQSQVNEPEQPTVVTAEKKAPETQRTNNINHSLFFSSASSAKHHPTQNFVRKLAQKCLGFKAKFNSAPNISNTAELESETPIHLKETDNLKSNTNTLHIGNSKFFKMLLKKEDSGEILCNDEFDTISLDRLGTINRDSVVNRSNRSCPGFKTSLPNISENNELSDSENLLTESVLITEKEEKNHINVNEAVNYNTKVEIFEPREMRDGLTIKKSFAYDSTVLVNECYESYEFSNAIISQEKNNNSQKHFLPNPPSKHSVSRSSSNKQTNIYENVCLTPKNARPTPAARTHVPIKVMTDNKPMLYENVVIKQDVKPEPLKRTFVRNQEINPNLKRPSLTSVSSVSSSSSSDSMFDESNLEDILISEKSKSFKHSSELSIYKSNRKENNRAPSATSLLSDSSDVTQASALENVDCSEYLAEKPLLPTTGTLPKPKRKSKIIFRNKTFTNLEVEKNSLPKWEGDVLKETLASYHIRGTGHCIFKAPTVQEFILSFNRESLLKDGEFMPKSHNGIRDSYFETAICFCRPQPPKHHKSAEDLDKFDEEPTVTIDFEAIKRRREISASSFRCYCDKGTCTLHVDKRILQNFIVKFSAIKKSISTPDITLETSPSCTASKKLSLINNKSVPHNLASPYAVVNVEEIARKNLELKIPVHKTLSIPLSTTSSSASRQYSIKDINDVLSINSDATNISCASDRGFMLRQSSSEYSGNWSLQSCESNVTIKSDASFKTCIEESSDDGSSGTMHSDEDSDADTIKSDVSTTKRPWAHSDSFRFGHKVAKPETDVIEEEDLETLKSTDKIESGISVGSGSSSSACDSIPGIDCDLSLGIASLERGLGVVGGVRSGSGRRRWEDSEFAGLSEPDALSVSSAASSCAQHPHAPHYHDYNKISPTPPKKPPRRNLSVSPTHANSPSSGYSYELRTHARSQDDLDDIQSAKIYLKHGRSIDQYVDSKLSYSEYEENHNSSRVIPVPNPRPSLKNRPQPVAITAMYENVVIKEQNPRRKLRRSFGPQTENCDPRMDRVRKYSNQERSSLESLLDSQSMNSPSDCERYYDGPRSGIPLSPTHYDQPPTPDHPPPSARQAENSIHERIRPLSQEYKRRSAHRDSQTEIEHSLLHAVSTASVASGATDRSGNTDVVEEYVCDVPFAGLFKGSTTTLDGIGLRPMPAERPKTLRKLKSVYDASPTEQQPITHPILSSNGQAERNTNGLDEEPRRRSNTTSSNHSGDKSLSILSPFDEQEEWAKISEIMASFGSKLVRESVFVSELEQEFTSRLGLSCSESSLSPSMASNLGLWLSGLGMHDYEPLFQESGFDDIDFINGIIDENDLREMGIEDNDRHKILDSVKQLPLKITEISNNHNNNNISKNQNESVDDWLRNINLEQYSDTFRKHLYVDMDRVRRIWEVELTAVLEIQKPGHRKRILASVSGENNGPISNMEDINADLNTLKNNIQQLKDEIKEKLPPSELLKPVPPPVVPSLAPPGGETLKRSKKNRPAPQPPRPSDLEIRAPSELLVGVPGALRTQWKHQPFVLVTGAVTYVANYLGSTVVKELRGTESTKKSIQKLKKNTKEPRDAPDIILSISYRGVKFLNTITRELVCEHEIRNIHCACQDADDLTHFAYITKDHSTKSHYCHVFRVATMDQATEVILTLGEAFEVAYQMALREQSNRVRVTQPHAKTPTHDPMTISNKEKPNVNHGRSHSITEIKLNGHQLKIASIPASLSNEDFQIPRASDGSRSPRTPLLKAPIASTEEL